MNCHSLILELSAAELENSFFRHNSSHGEDLTFFLAIMGNVSTSTSTSANPATVYTVADPASIQPIRLQRATAGLSHKVAELYNSVDLKPVGKRVV